MSRVVIVSRQRLIGATNGSSAYLLDLARSVRAAGFAPHLLQPSPDVMGRVPFYRARPEMTVFASHRIRGVARIGRWFVSRDPGVWSDAVLGVIRGLARRLGVTAPWTRDRPRPYAIAAPWRDRDRAWLAAQQRGAPADLAIADYAFQAEAFAVLGMPRSRCAIVMHDLFHARSGSGAGADRDSVAVLGREEELALLARAGAVMAIQRDEAEMIAGALPGTRVIVAPGTRAPETAHAPGDPARLLFVGSRTAPNSDGLRWFLETAWPQLRAAAPALRLDVVGTVAADFSGSAVPDGVHLHGLVPDLAPFYRQAGIVISPLRFGSGLKIKLVEALAWGKPTVVTPVTLQGVEEVCGPAVLVAETAEGLVAAIRALRGDAALRARLSRRARAVVAEHFSADAAHREFRTWLQDAAKGSDGAGTLLPPEARVTISCFQ